MSRNLPEMLARAKQGTGFHGFPWSSGEFLRIEKSGAFYAWPSSLFSGKIWEQSLCGTGLSLANWPFLRFYLPFNMPTYEYICQKCEHQFDVFQSMKDPALTVCPKEKCRMKKWGKGKVKKMVSGGAGLIFKGSGFYITDYRSDSYKEAAKKDAPPAPAAETTGGKSEGKSDAKTESKPAKTEAKPPKPAKK
jgi:putative FmdB family regulatory protein